MSAIKRKIDDFISDLSKKSGYSWDFLMDRFNEVMEEDGDLDYFVGVTMEHDW